MGVKKNLLIVISSLEIGGAQKLVGDLIPFLAQHFNVKVVVFKKTNSLIEQHIEEKNVPIISFNIGTHSPLAIFKLRKLIKEADIVHSHLFPANYYSILANIGLKKPIIFTEHSTYNKRRNYPALLPLERFVYKRFNKIVSISDATKLNLDNWLNLKDFPNKNIVVENGVDLSRFKETDVIKNNNFFGRKGIPLLMISRFTQAKDHQTVIRALCKISNPEIFVVFVGDGDTKESIEKFAEESGVSDRVIFLGKRNDIENIICNAKIGIQSSKWEGFGLTAIEMMAGGIPVIASDVVGLSDVVKDAGLLFPPGDDSTLAKKITEILSSPDFYNDLCRKGYERAKQFSVESTAKKHIEIYNSLLRH